LHLYAIRAIGTHLYVAGEQGLLLRLDRDRQHFEALDLPYEGTLFGVVGDARGLVAFGLRGNALRSTDGGSTWTTLDTGLSVTLTAGAPSPDGALVLASQTGQLLVSRDAGATVAPLALPRRVPASAFLPMRDGSLIIAGPRGLHRIVPAGTQE
ncbi:MAG TPA: hypothetical protein VJM11_15105, partial [Nevskiaceae bacterium]|nr:hypothetical protein [Nevskiaceae bacterium]